MPLMLSSLGKSEHWFWKIGIVTTYQQITSLTNAFWHINHDGTDVSHYSEQSEQVRNTGGIVGKALEQEMFI